jgi:hypothetical protein
MRPCAIFATIAGCAVCYSLGGTGNNVLSEEHGEANEAKWQFSLSTYTYLAQHSRDYTNPIFTADRDWLHLEARYNYEDLQTGSVWLGYNLSTGNKLKFELTPMLGGVFGKITGIAPGYTITVDYKTLEFSMQGEYFCDAGTSSNNFFYTWSELSDSPVEWFRMGVAVERTQASGSNSDFQLGPLIGFKYKDIALTTYWLGAGSDEAKFVFAATVNF